MSLDHRRVAAFAPGDRWRTHPRRMGPRPNPQHLHRGRASADRPRRGHHLCGDGTSHEGFDAEWRGVEIMTVDGDLVNRSEVFDEDDLEAALARFEELSQPAPRLENAASQASERLSPTSRPATGTPWPKHTAPTRLFLADDRRSGCGRRDPRAAEMPVESANCRATRRQIGAKRTT